jgi:hypothetical protein
LYLWPSTHIRARTRVSVRACVYTSGLHMVHRTPVMSVSQSSLPVLSRLSASAGAAVRPVPPPVPAPLAAGMPPAAWCAYRVAPWRLACFWGPFGTAKGHRNRPPRHNMQGVQHAHGQRSLCLAAPSKQALRTSSSERMIQHGPAVTPPESPVREDAHQAPPVPKALCLREDLVRDALLRGENLVHDDDFHQSYAQDFEDFLASSGQLEAGGELEEMQLVSRLNCARAHRDPQMLAVPL